MDASSELREFVTENRSVRLIEDDIYSVLPDTSVPHHYDNRAAIYDLVVSTRLYNFVMWGSSPRDYVAFVRQALNSSPDGSFLDAGCGSMLFSARAYVNSNRYIVAFDQSLAMLRRARQRLIQLSGGVPDHIRLLQGDLSDIPFRTGIFCTFLCLNVLHQFADAASLISNLKELLKSGGGFYLTSLVLNNRTIGNWYLKALFRTGEFVHPRTERKLRELLDEGTSFSVKGNMIFAESSVALRG